ncbi:autotransporter CRAC-like isoform X25 [Dysidea avara]|uniref:autotransporter CRAC-like isoform X25 n=1 Tax=Dysidea avara TaxID=196820 RepID=UPI00331BC9F5
MAGEALDIQPQMLIEATIEEQVSTVPTKRCQHCGHQSHIRCEFCGGCEMRFPESQKRLATGPPRKHATDLLSQLYKKANQLNQVGYDIVILGHKVNQKNQSYPIMGTDGPAKGFLRRFENVSKLWRLYFDNDQSTVVNGSQEGTVVNGSQEGTVVNGSQQGTVVNGNQQGTVVNRSQQGTVVNGSQQGTVVNGSQQGTVVNGSQQGTGMLDGDTSQLRTDFSPLVVNGSQQGTVCVNGSQQGTIVNGNQEGTVVNGSQQVTVVNGSQQGTVVNGSQQGTVVNGSQQGTVVNGSQEGTGMYVRMVILDHYNRDFPVGSRSRQGTVVNGSQQGTIVSGSQQGTARKKRKRRCGTCAGCRSDNCGRCKSCLKPTLKQACVKRLCLSMK